MEQQGDNHYNQKYEKPKENFTQYYQVTDKQNFIPEVQQPKEHFTQYYQVTEKQDNFPVVQKPKEIQTQVYQLSDGRNEYPKSNYLPQYQNHVNVISHEPNENTGKIVFRSVIVPEEPKKIENDNVSYVVSTPIQTQPTYVKSSIKALPEGKPYSHSNNTSNSNTVVTFKPKNNTNIQSNPTPQPPKKEFIQTIEKNIPIQRNQQLVKQQEEFKFEGNPKNNSQIYSTSSKVQTQTIVPSKKI